MKSIKYALLLLLLLGVFPTFAQQQQQVPAGFLPVIPIEFEILNTYPHDATAFTQGLLWYEGSLYESTGQEGESTLREVNPVTGAIIRSIPVRRSPEELAGENAPPDYFAEGLELVGDRLLQLTWKAQEAFIYDRESFELLDTIEYEGQGWGICSDGRYYYMSDSSQYLAIREIESFELIGRMLVTFSGQPLQRNLLNELECVGDEIYANLWQTNYIVRIDKFSGNISGIVDASELLTEEQRAELTSSSAVLNGIAYQPESDTFFITGKYWPVLFEVRLTPAEAQQ